MRFKNPYHFVPVVKGDRRGDVGVAEFLSKAGITHASYGRDLHSGTLRCRLRLETATVVGGEQSREKGGTATVEPFYLDGKLGIGGSTLRGMISSVAEAASDSALRVLDGKAYSYRKSMKMGKALSAIGMIVPIEKGFGLFPLTLPTLEEEGGWFALPRKFGRYFPEPILRVYVGHSDGSRPDDLYIKGKEFRYRTSNPQSEVAPDWFADVLPLSWKAPDDLRLQRDDSKMHVKGRYLLAQRVTGLPSQVRTERSVQGYMRVLGCWGRGDEIPVTKKHELFLPCPRFYGPFPIPESVVGKFEGLADERYEESQRARRNDPSQPLLPFHPLDRARGTVGDQKLRFQAGDFVYFDVDEKTGEVCEVSFSSIWRGAVETSQRRPASAHDFFRALDSEILPFGEARKQVTPAEQLFGFATDGRIKTGVTAYAGRVRIGDAHLDEATVPGEGPLLRSVTLKVLSSPKPPCPSMYFQPNNRRRVAKDKLRPGASVPQGRKFYLHHFVQPGDEPWKTGLPDELKEQKATVRPLRPGLEFSFEVCFDNLTDSDLGLLLYSLAPEDDYCHKVGMGKSLGLGSVKVRVVACEMVNRQQRYTVAGFAGPRSAPLADWRRLRDEFREGMNGDIRKALQLLGQRPVDAEPSVMSPNVAPRPNEEDFHAERKLYRWFVANDAGLTERPFSIAPQEDALKPLAAGSQELPTLERYEWIEQRAFTQGGGR